MFLFLCVRKTVFFFYFADQLYHLRKHNPKPERGGEVENKIDQLRRDLQSEINNLHIQLQRNAVDNNIHRDFRDM